MMVPLKEEKNYYAKCENEDDTKIFIEERTSSQSLASFTYDPNSSYNNSFILEKMKILFNFCKKVHKFNTYLMLLVMISFILNCITVHYMSLMKGYVDEYVPKISSELDEAYVRFNEDSDQINYVSNIIQSDEFKQRYDKISEFVDIITVEDVERINELILNVDPIEVGQLIHILCQMYNCDK